MDQSLGQYLREQIATGPLQPVFDEAFALRDLYVPLLAQPVDAQGQVDETAAAQDLESWARESLDATRKQELVLFVQAGPGLGKSVFCRLFADWVRQHRSPTWTPILIPLGQVRRLEKTLEKTLQTAVEQRFAIDGDHWLTHSDTRFLFLLDGFDQLRAVGRGGGSLAVFLQQVAAFQQRCREGGERGHQVLLTGRTSALKTLERSLPVNLERVEIRPLKAEAQAQWFSHWGRLAGAEVALALQQFLANPGCPEPVRALAREPLTLYLLAAMHRDGAFRAEPFADISHAAARDQLYQQTLAWLLHHQSEAWLGSNSPQARADLRCLWLEAGVWITQSAQEAAPLSAVAQRLPEEGAAVTRLQALPRLGATSLHSRWATCHFPANEQARASIEFTHHSFSEFLYAERLRASLVSWSQGDDSGFLVPTAQMDWALYDLLGFGELSREIVSSLMALLTDSSEYRPEVLFKRLEDFYFRWSDGVFIDAETLEQNLPHRKMRQLKAQQIALGLRQVDVYVGLNSLILLLELHRQAQSIQALKEKIFFFPCGPQGVKFDATRIARLIGYSHCLEANAFLRIVSPYLEGISLNSATLQGVNLIGANLSGANLIGADLSSTNLAEANLSHASLWGANLRGANLRSAELWAADLSSADLSNTYLIRASFRDADLSEAKLSGAVLWGVVLSGANLGGVNLIRASLNGANLSGANLGGANLSGASLRGSDLSGANLSSTDLFQVNFSGTNLAGIRWDENTKWEGAKGLESARNVPEALQDTNQDWSW